MTALHIGDGVSVERQPVDADGRVIVAEVVGYDDDGKPIFCTVEDPPEEYTD